MKSTNIVVNPIELGLPAVNIKPAARNPTLDVIRAIAILLVIISHLALIDDGVIINSPFRYVQSALSFIRVGGWSGVDLFFVLSGFLVSGLLFKEYKNTKAIKAKTFLIRRGFKIYPSFVFFLIFSGVVEFVLKSKFHKGTFLITDYIKDLFFLHNYLGGRWATTWSLDVEEAFYFLLAGFFLLITKFNKLSFRGLITTYIALVILSVTGRLIMNIQHPIYSFELHYSYSHLRLDALFFGVILSYLYHYHKERLTAFFSKYKNVILPLSIMMILPNFLFAREQNNWISIFLLSTNPIAYGALVMLALNSKATFFKNKPLAFIGTNSYAMYLWFSFLNTYLQKYFSPHTSVRGFIIYAVLYLSGTITCGTVITKIIEEPFLKLRERLYGTPIKAKAPQVNQVLVPGNTPGF